MTMAAHAPRLARLFSPTFARAINTQLVYPAISQVVKPNELESALAKPLHKAHYQPESSTAELAASLSFGIIKGLLTQTHNTTDQSLLCVGHPFLDGNKRTGSLFTASGSYLELTISSPAFFLANEYVRAQGLPGLADEGKVSEVYMDVHEFAERHIGVASGQLSADALIGSK
jgi:prophage maintenance system killer protein